MHLSTSRLLIAGLSILILATACGTDDAQPPASPSPGETVGGPQTVTVNVDGVIEGSNVALLGYFPRELTVRQGDTVEFSFQPGDPHTVSFGTLIDELVDARATFDPEGPEPEVFQKVPQAFDDAGESLIYAGALPCFSDEPPVDGPPCEEVEQPAFDGSLPFYNSGLLTPTATFSMPISDDAQPGTYSYICVLHGPDMGGEITVVGSDESVPSPSEVTAAAAADLAEVTGGAEATLAAQPTGTHPGLEDLFESGPDRVLAGGIVEGPVLVDILQFGPTDVTIAAGESVVWNMVGFHTVSFNPTQDATPEIILGDDGLPTINPLAFAPQGGAAGAPPPPDGAEEEPEGPPGPPIAIFGGEWDGTGFFSSGVLPSFPPVLLTYEIRFSTSGTYTYRCLIHQDMEGTVNVT